MSSRLKVVKVRGHLKNYPWGQKDGLLAFQADRNVQPQAELWFGNHPAGQSAEVATSAVLSSKLEFPLLVKILAIAKPLSIQVHPSQLFANENYSQLALSDKNGKDEILIALDTVWAFAGIRENSDRKRIAHQLKLASFEQDFSSQCSEIFSFSDLEIGERIDLIAEIFKDEKENTVFKNLIENYPKDPGVLVAALLEFYELEPGEGLHVPPGCPHEYLKGKAIEVMTNSDNVFRMGLTNKPIDRKNALLVLTDDVVEKFSSGVEYKPKSNFEVKLLEDTVVELRSNSYQAMLCLAGTARIEIADGEHTLVPGEALLVSGAATAKATINGRVSVAIHKEDGRL